MLERAALRRTKRTTTKDIAVRKRFDARYPTVREIDGPVDDLTQKGIHAVPPASLQRPSGAIKSTVKLNSVRT